MADLRESLEAAFAEAGIAVPDDLATFALESLEELVPDKRQRGKCKSALVRLRKSLGISEQAPAAASAAVPAPPAEAPAPEPEPAAETVAAAEDVSAEEAVEDEPEAVAAAPMSEALAAKFADVTAAFAAASAAVPADPVGLSLDSLDELIEDKASRAKCKSALVKFRRAAEAEGWQPAAARPARVRATPAAAPGSAAAGLAATAAAAATADAPSVPASAAGDLWLLAGGAWTQLGQASVVPSHADEIVNQKGAHGHLERITNILVLDGKFEVPPDLYNTWCYLAHEGMVYRAYYISHVGDVRRGTRTASLKIDESYSFEQFAQLYNGLNRKDRPTADDLRKYRFGGQYHSYKNMFSERPARMV